MKQQQGQKMLAVIPGRAIEKAFIQVITQNGSHYIPYPLASYHHSGMMQVGNSAFSRYGMRLDIDIPALTLQGRLRYSGLTPLPYGIVGQFEVLPLETKHTVHSMRHRVSGKLAINGKPLSFKGVGYMEGDMGHSFPNGYTWLQSIDFNTEASVMLTVAGIPLMGCAFTGCIAVVCMNGRQYRFATYLGVRVVLQQGSMRGELLIKATNRCTSFEYVQGQPKS